MVLGNGQPDGSQIGQPQAVIQPGQQQQQFVVTASGQQMPVVFTAPAGGQVVAAPPPQPPLQQFTPIVMAGPAIPQLGAGPQMVAVPLSTTTAGASINSIASAGGSSSYTYTSASTSQAGTSYTTSPYGSGSAGYMAAGPGQGMFVAHPGGNGGVYGVSTEGPPIGVGGAMPGLPSGFRPPPGGQIPPGYGGPLQQAPKAKKKKKKKKSKTPVITKEEQEAERLRQQAELEAAVKPDMGSVVDERQLYLQDDGPKQVIINYLPLELKEDELKQLFEQYGPVEAARFVTDKNSGKSKGYGFVYFYYSRHASEAIKQMNGFELYGRILRVSYAVPQRPRPPPGEEVEEVEGDANISPVGAGNLLSPPSGPLESDESDDGDE